MNSNWLLGLLAVAGAGGALYLYQKNRKETKGVEVAISDFSTKWLYEPITQAKALEIANYCRTISSISAKQRNAQVLTAYGFPQFALTCFEP